MMIHPPPLAVANGAAKAAVKAPVKFFNPFDYYSGDEDDGDYQFAHYKVRTFLEVLHREILCAWCSPMSIYVSLILTSSS